jgi:HEPN domain-containing protein
MKPIEGDMLCDAGFLVLPECLDQSYESSTPCFPLTVRLPRFDPNVHPHNLIAPYSEFRVARDEDDAAGAQYAGDSAWGCMQDWSDPVTPGGWETNSFVPNYFVVEQLRFITEGSAADDDEFQHTSDHIRDHRATWWSILADWIGVVSTQDLIELGKQRRHSFARTSTWIADPQEGKERGFSWIQMPELRSYVGEPLSRAQLAMCMSLTGEQTRPPEAWLMVRDARSLLHSGEYRRAVLDTGTAAELALTATLDKYLAANSSPDVAEALMDGTKMLGRLKEVVKKLKLAALPREFQAQVIDPRNAAAHSGQAMTKEVAEAAISATSELLHATHPLSDFGFSPTRTI